MLGALALFAAVGCGRGETLRPAAEDAVVRFAQVGAVSRQRAARAVREGDSA